MEVSCLCTASEVKCLSYAVEWLQNVNNSNLCENEIFSSWIDSLKYYRIKGDLKRKFLLMQMNGTVG